MDIPFIFFAQVTFFGLLIKLVFFNDTTKQIIKPNFIAIEFLFFVTFTLGLKLFGVLELIYEGRDIIK